MFTTDDPGALAELLNSFQVPMFVADCEDDDIRADAPSYRLVTINDAHSRESSLSKDVCGASVNEILPPPEASLVNRQYATCIRSGGLFEYDEMLTINGQETKWHTMLLPTVTDSGRRRVVGNALLIDAGTAPDRSRRLFEDINYFSVQSQFQLAQVASYIEALESGARPNLAATDLQILAGLCRTVDRTLNDIRALAEPTLKRDAPCKHGYLLDICGADAAPRDPVRRSLADLSRLLDPLH